MDCAENEFAAVTVYYSNWTIFAHAEKGKSELSMTEWPDHVLLQKKWYEPQRRQPWEFITDFYAPIWVIGFCVFAMDKMFFKARKCVGNAFSRDLETQMLEFPPSLPIMGVPQEILTKQTGK